jgi:flagellar assembly protein FliH
MSAAPLPRFSFDTVFDGEGVVVSSAPRPKRHYTPEEVEAVRAQAYAEGERSVTALAEMHAAAALHSVSTSVTAALPLLAHAAHAHRAESAELALAAARKIADAALDQFPTAAAEAALVALAREIEAAPRLVVRAAPELIERLQPALDRVAEACGYPGQIIVKSDPEAAPAAFVFDWGEGRAAFDPEEAAERVAAALRTALAAEGLHAEPLISAPEADHG